MATLLELAADIVASHASTSTLTSEELVLEIQKVYSALKALEPGKAPIVELSKPAITVKEAFKKNEVICMICGKGGMKTLTRHLKTAHDMKPTAYKKQHGIPASQKLAAKSFSESRKKWAVERGLVDILAKARDKRMANLKEKNAVPEKTTKVKAPMKTM
jgi:predicted transcriptional regulator